MFRSFRFGRLRDWIKIAALVLWALTPVRTQTQAPPPARPVTLIAVYLRAPDFLVRDMKFRVFYNKFEAKVIPLSGFDFQAALADELRTVLSEDRKWEWTTPTAEESIFAASYFDVKNKQGNLPSSVRADRLLLVDVREYGAFMGAVDRFYISAELRLLERDTGRQLWKKGMYERIPLKGKLDELQADNQKGLKEGMNDVLEKFARRVMEKMPGAKV